MPPPEPPPPPPASSVLSGGYTVDDLDRLRGEVQKVSEGCVEAIRAITEAVIWGEKYDDSLFDYFCEKAILPQFLTLLDKTSTSTAVKVQLLQALCILVQNLSKPTYTYYLFSNHHLDAVISSLAVEADCVGLYISLLKSLAMKLNKSTIHFFFDQVHGRFPLYVEAAKFLYDKECMVRTHSRTLVLKVFEVSDPECTTFIVRRSSFFTHFAWHLRGLFLRMRHFVPSSTGGRWSSQANTCLEDIEEGLYFAEDVMDLGIQPISQASQHKQHMCIYFD
eukprot:GHVS01083557.1.p1 GENE.GHVS01083557.1~~GHVS01083557.1.p1  ORF type:complete len:311 (-),score=80.02 GHVS01083557.1:1172-2005(-)